MYNRSAILTLLIVTLSIVSIHSSFAQSNPKDVNTSKRKVGLVLSGGGAKGLAHIGLLKLIDSLGIKIDYITGTSMGGVLGGLYAMGYSANQLDSIASAINWKRILSNKSPLNEVNIIEKDEYSQYVINLPVNGAKPGLPNALVEGQFLSETLNTLTFPVRNINDFAKLPIPVKVATTDIVTGERVLQTKHSLPLALRATMSIPGAFAMTYINGHPFVDGGLARNFPVEEVREMGADIVIGGYTGFRLYVQKEIEQPLKMMVQTQAFGSVEDSKKQMKKTDILINFNEALVNFGPSDFAQHNAIIAAGKKQALQSLPQLLNLAKTQQRAKKLQPFSSHNLRPTNKYYFLAEEGDTINNQKDILFLKKLLNLQQGIYYAAPEVNKAINNLYGTQFYNKVYYTFNNQDDSLTMNIHLREAPKTTFRASVHYDTDQSAGVVLNYTFRNFLFKRSRLLATVDAAERFKFRLNYYHFFPKTNNIWIKAHFDYQNLKSNDFILNLSSASSTNVPDYFNRISTAFIGPGFALNKNMMVETGLLFESENIFRKKNIISRVIGIPDANTLYKHHNFAAVFRLSQNNLNAPYYASKGNRLTVEAKYSFSHHLKLADPIFTDSAEMSLYDYFNPESDLYNNGNPGNITRLLITNDYIQPLSKKISLIFKGFAGINYSNKHGISESNYLYFNDKFAIGGIEDKLTSANPNFIGLNRQELPYNAITSLGLALQYNLFTNFYLIPQANYGWENRSFNVLENIFKQDPLVGYGMRVGYMSVIGPIDFSISKSDLGGLSLPWRAYFSFGYKF